MSILDTKIQYFEGKIWKPKPLGEIPLREFIRAHQNPRPEIKEVFNKIAEAEKKEDWETKGRLKQKNLFYFTPCVKLDGKGRAYQNVEAFQQMMVLDFDHLTTDAATFRDELFEKLKSVILAYKSPSGKGVKALVRIPLVKSVDEFKEYFYGIAYDLEHMPSFDCSGANSVLPLFISWDENIRWREDPEVWTKRGGKYNEFEEFTGDIEEVEDVTDQDKKEVLQRVYKQVQKADEEQIGHTNILSAALIGGGFCSSGYITYDEIENYLFKWIDESPYLSQKASTYKKTAVTMLNKGLQAPLYLRRHQEKDVNTQSVKNKEKRDRKYYRLCSLVRYEKVNNEQT